MICKNDTIFIIVCIIVACLIADTLLAKIYNFTVIDTSSNWRTIIFLIIGIVSAICQYFVLEFIGRKCKEIRLSGQLNINLIQKIVTITQSVITGLLILIFFQMITEMSFNNYIVIVGMTISYSLATALMTMLAKRFFSWFLTNRNLVVVLYAISSAILAINSAVTLVYVAILLFQQPVTVYPHPSTVSPAQFLGTESLTGALNQAFIISSIMSFASFWIATVFLMKYYSKKIGRAMYWFLVSIPLIYFVCQFSPYFLDIFSSIRQSQPIMFGMIYTIIFTLSKPTGGILFGIAFWVASKSLPEQSNVKVYLIISALGIVLLFTSNQAIILVSFSYPPFGIATISFMGLGSYLILVGVYSSAISIAQDSKLRQTIRRSAIKESKLLDSIGLAHMEDQLMSNVLKTVKLNQKNLTQETGIETSMSQEEIKDYLYDVIKETRVNAKK